MYFNKFMIGSCELQKVADKINKLKAEIQEGSIMVQMHNRAADFNYKTRGMTLAAKAEYRKTLKPMVVVEAKIKTDFSYY